MRRKVGGKKMREKGGQKKAGENKRRKRKVKCTRMAKNATQNWCR